MTRMLALAFGWTLAACSSSSGIETPPPAVFDPGPPSPPVTQFQYPSGPYGYRIGQVLPGSLEWRGYGAGKDDRPMTVGISAFYDPDGSKGINAVIFDASAVWCAACVAEAQDLEDTVQTAYGAEGVSFVTLMFEAAVQGQPATLATAKEWRDTYRLYDVDVLADPAFEFMAALGAGATSVSLPLSLLVDPRTMKVVDVMQGYGPSAWAADVKFQKLLLANRPH